MSSHTLELRPWAVILCVRVHEVWTLVFKHRIHLWVERVPSKYNISDSPSRSEYQIKHDIHAQWRWPVLDELHILSR